MSDETTPVEATAAGDTAESQNTATEAQTPNPTAQPGSPDPTRDHDGAQGQAEEGGESKPDDSTTSEAEPTKEYDYSGLRAGEDVSADRIQSVVEFAKGENLSPEVAQKLLDRDSSTVKAEHERLVKSLEEQRSQWQEEVKSDPKLGGDMLPVTRRRVDGFVGKFDQDGSLRALLDDYGYMDHPAVVRFLNHAAEAFEPGRVAPGQTTASAPQTAAEIMYGSS